MKKVDKKNKDILLSLLKKIRRDAGWRQTDLAKKISVTQSSISKYEMGERRLDILELRTICHVFGMPLIDFVKILEEKINKNNDEAN